MLDQNIKPDASVCRSIGVKPSQLKAVENSTCHGCVFSDITGRVCSHKGEETSCGNLRRSDGKSVIWVKEEEKKQQRVDVHSILVHTPSIEAQRIYRVTAIKLGALGEEGYVELEPLGLTSDIPLCLPHLMLDDMVDKGIIQIVWGKE
jgi:hypothetical protein